MTLEIAWSSQCRLRPALALLILVALAVLGRGITPLENGQPQLLTPLRWQRLQLARQAEAETGSLARDARLLRDLAQQEQPDAIQALSLAQQVAQHYRVGTPLTAAARQALIAAAEALARYAAGGLEREPLVSAINTALARIQALEPRVEKIHEPTLVRQHYLPLLRGGGHPLPPLEP